MASLLVQFEDLRKKAESCLSTSASAQEAKPFTAAMAETALPLSTRYQHIPAETIITDNITGDSQQEDMEYLSRLVKALSVLEKYGCNLLNPNRPKFWRNVKFNNPVFRASVDTIEGGRNVLMLYGYTEYLDDGLKFPDDVTAPDIQLVAAVTAEVMTLRTELDSLNKGEHSHPEFFEKTILSIPQQEEEKIVADAVVFQPVPRPRTGPVGGKPNVPPRKPLTPPTPPSVSECEICGKAPCLLCKPCGSLSYCEKCDQQVHLHPSKTKHIREPIQKTQQEKCVICGHSPVSVSCVTCDRRLCVECDKLYHSHPNRVRHTRLNTATSTPLSNEIKKPRVPTAAPAGPSTTEWECVNCTVINSGSSVLCEVCERPRLAKQASLPEAPQAQAQWECQKCTFINASASIKCEMCETPREESPVKNIPLIPRAAGVNDVPVYEPEPRSEDLQKQTRMREDGLKLLQQLKEGEKRGISPEHVYAALQLSEGSNPFDWLESELPHLLDEICALAASMQTDYRPEQTGQQPGSDGQIWLSRAEAKQAWLSSGGNTQKAATHLLKKRADQLDVLRSIGFVDRLVCEKALFECGGDLESALCHLQRPLMERFHQNIWKEQPEISFDINHPDKDWLCRRLLGLCNLNSWGRSQLALSLLQETNVEYSLEDVIQAVREHQDRDFISRILKQRCEICYCEYPQRKMRALISCQCSMCSDCFKLHFTVALKDKHIRDMVCPLCAEPDINDPEVQLTYFSTLDVQLKVCLEPDVFTLFGNKLMEHTLKKDPKFLWCCHCTNGFINDKDELKITCPNCRQSFCSKCKKPWEDQHEGLTCEAFQKWKRDNDPEYQKQGLAGFLRENGINCPECKFQYDLAKGGCMHFTCNQCRHEFCSGCNSSFHKKPCSYPQCTTNGLHAHHPRDCLYYMRDWEPAKLQALLQTKGVVFNTDPPNDTESATCGVMEQKDGGDTPCGAETKQGHAGLCDKHYREYLVSLINANSLDPAVLMDVEDLITVCKRHHVITDKLEGEEEEAYKNRLQQKLMEIPLGDKVPRKM